MKRAVVAMASSLLLACTASENQADTMSLGAVDTLKPAADSASVTPVAGASTATAPAAGVTQSKNAAANQSTTGTKAAPADTTNIGRDRAIQINTKDPKVRLPTVDTTKRPPGGA
jgi:hypothetical protein